MRTGVSTACFYPELTERALQLVVEAGAPCTEIFVNAESEFTPAFFDRLAAVSRESGVDIVSIHPFTSGFEPILFFSTYERRMQDGMNLYRRFFEMTARAGARYFVLHGAHAQAAMPDELIFERFLLLRKLAAREGVRLLQENVARCKSRSPEFICKMRRYLGEEAEFVLDTKQALRSGVCVEEMLLAMGEGVRHIHISDCSSEKDCVLPGRGEFDIAAFVRLLLAGGYQGELMLEVYRDSFGQAGELFGAYRYLSQTVEKALKKSSAAG